MRLQKLLEPVEKKRLTGPQDVEITGLSYDSRAVEPGNAFFCIKGLVTDGHLYVMEAVGAGASAVFIERLPDEEIDGDIALVRVPDTRRALAICSSRFYDDPSRELRLVGITGTNGKTTTAYLVEGICREAGMTTGLIGTVRNVIAGAVEPVTRTTPESLDLQRLLRRMADSGVDVVSMEVSSHALELHRAAGCEFDVVVFTNLTQDHLDFHLSLEEYFGAKKRLFAAGESGEARRAVINTDDPFGRRLMEEASIPSRGYGFMEGAEIKGKDLRVSSDGSSFVLSHGGGELELLTHLKGRFNAYNCLAAASTCIELGVDDSAVAAGISGMKGVPGRFESIDCGQDFLVIVDYAHTPDGIRSLLEACREVTPGRVILVIGCGGDRDRSKRPLMGSVGTGMSDLCVITSDNPRSEEPMAIIEMMLTGVRDRFPAERYRVEVDRREAVLEAMRLARSGDMVVIAGKGHESGQIIADRIIPFDDREVARESLREVLGA